jgi:hypothetical protein
MAGWPWLLQGEGGGQWLVTKPFKKVGLCVTKGGGKSEISKNRDTNYMDAPIVNFVVYQKLRGMQLQVHLYRNLPFSTFIYNYLQLLLQLKNNCR